MSDELGVVPEKTNDMTQSKEDASEHQAASSQDVQMLQGVMAQVQGMIVHNERIPYSEATFLKAIDAATEKDKIQAESVKHLMNWCGSILVLVILVFSLILFLCFYFNKLEQLKEMCFYVALVVSGHVLKLPKRLKHLYDDSNMA